MTSLSLSYQELKVWATCSVLRPGLLASRACCDAPKLLLLRLYNVPTIEALTVDERQRMKVFLSRAVDLHCLAGLGGEMPVQLPEDVNWVSTVMECLDTSNREPVPLYAASFAEFLVFAEQLRAKWNTSIHRYMLRARALDDAVTETHAKEERLNGRREEDVRENGLHPCGLPSCDKREATVDKFKYCGACFSAWYCCAEHQVLHWQTHKLTCRAPVATPEATNDAQDGFHACGLPSCAQRKTEFHQYKPSQCTVSPLWRRGVESFMEEDEADEGYFFRLRSETRRVPGLKCDAVHLLVTRYLFIYQYKPPPHFIQ